MASSLSADERVAQLTRDADKSITAGSLELALRQLQEASAIDSGNAKLKETWERLEKQRDQSPLVSLCQKWLDSQVDEQGEEALDYMAHHEIPSIAAERAMEVLLRYSGESDVADQLCGVLMKQPGAQKTVAGQFHEQPTDTFRKLWEHGDDSVEGLVVTVFAKSAWPSDTDRTAALRDVFQLALAELMSPGLEHPDRAMKAVSRLLGAEASKLNGIIDADGFDVILTSLDIRLPQTLRSHATVATAKLLQLSPDSAQQLISNYVTNKVVKPTAESLLLAFSAAAAVFPMAPTVAADLFLSEGFLSAFVPMVKTRKSRHVEQAALELLSAACINKACREGIAKFCRDWLEDIASTATDPKRASLAALILIKIEDETVRVGSPLQSRGPGLDQDTDLVNNFKNMVLTPDDTSKKDAVEGLAYASLKPHVKEYLAKDQTFLIHLINLLSNSRDGRPSLFGGLTIFANLTAYRPAMSEEQKKLSQLKAYANTTKPADADPLDDDERVTARCKKVLDAGIVPLLVTCSKGATQTIIVLVVQILFSLAKEQKHRGVMSQQGSVKLLLYLYDTVSVQPASVDGGLGSKISSLRLAAHAAARILISVNPTHVFGSATALISPIRPLVSLLNPIDDESSSGSIPSSSPPLLATFEALLALTNLASTDAPTADAIVRAAWPQTEDLLLSSHEMVQRAAAELVCNLCAAPQGIAKFADGSGPAGNRLHILLALADAEDVATRRAAGGALAMLTEWPEVVDAVLKREKGIDILLEMCEDEDGEDLRHRGFVCVGKRAKAEVLENDGKARVTAVLKETKNPEVLSVGIGILKAIA
ncbi:CRO1 protein [Rhizodiscina lignyota]|uniref:CRO1 protein n=1 Tax=Rhizodiscina lignyota TaxID=1504668 RepID=A0A9P4I8I1_9PEZI|nr:CRO1 protein [Rhizodiscina lignyota]